MAQYKVPQFIEVEDKLFGPLTFKQAVYLVGGAAASFVLWQVMPPIISFVTIILIVAIMGLAAALAFVKIDNQPFIVTLEAASRWGLRKMLGNNLYIWKRDPKAQARLQKRIAGKRLDKKEAKDEKPKIAIPTISQGKIRDLAWSLDINENIDKH